MPLRLGRVVQPAQRDEAGEEFGFLPRLAGLRLAVIGGDAIGRRGIAEAQQLARQHLALRPDGALRLGRKALLQGLAGGPECRRFLIAVAAAQRAGAVMHQADVARQRRRLDLAV